MMGISRSTFYREATRRKQQLDADEILRKEISEVLREFPGYGYRRIHEHLLRDGKRINSKRIRRVMKEYNLRSCRTKLMKPKGSAIGKRLFHPNLTRGLRLNGPDQLWATDITYIRLEKEYVYLSAVLDVYTRKVIGWGSSNF